MRGVVVFARAFSLISPQRERKREWWLVPDFETEVNKDSRSTYGGRSVGTRDFCPALGALVGTE